MNNENAQDINRATLTGELGRAIKDVWSVRQRRYGGQFERVGNLSIPGMLRRLGMTGLSKKIAASEKAGRDASDKRRRNSVRRQARELAGRLIELIQQHPEILSLASLTALATLENES